MLQIIIIKLNSFVKLFENNKDKRDVTIQRIAIALNCSVSIGGLSAFKIPMHRTTNFSQVEKITHSGAMFIGTYDNFTDGDPAGFLKNINSHMKTADENKLVFIERTGHTYQQKEQEAADKLLQVVARWRGYEEIPKVS